MGTPDPPTPGQRPQAAGAPSLKLAQFCEIASMNLGPWTPPPAGELPMDHSLVRQVAGLVQRLPAVDSPQFRQDYLTVSHCIPGRSRALAGD